MCLVGLRSRSFMDDFIQSFLQRSVASASSLALVALFPRRPKNYL